MTTVVHPQWERWAAENLAGGAEPEQVIEALVDGGASLEEATIVVESLRTSAALSVVTELQRRVRALETMLRLRYEHRRPVVSRGPLPSVEEFLARHWVPGVPGVFEDLVPRWPAFERWSFDELVARFGHVEVEASIGRDAVRMPDADWQQVRKRLPLSALVPLMLDPSTGNDVYVISKNAMLREPGLAPLRDEVALPETFFVPGLDPLRAALWLGPAGTHTPLHHDGDDAMFCQVVGRKRVRLAPPESIALLDRSDGVYCRWDPRTPEDLAEPPEPLLEVELGPGDALFLPAGWWHQIDALEPSMSVSVLQFAFPNDYGWYKPGSQLRGTA